MTSSTAVENKVLVSSSTKSNNITRQTIAEGHYEKMGAKEEQLVSLAMTCCLYIQEKNEQRYNDLKERIDSLQRSHAQSRATMALILDKIESLRYEQQ